MAPSLVRRTRLVVLTGGALFMFLGPLDRQVLHREHAIFKAWRMYSGVSTRNCVATYFVPAADGGWRPIDRLRVLYGVHHWTRATEDQRTLRNHAAVRRAGATLCSELGARQIVAEAKCASRAGWVLVEAGDGDLCAP